MEYFKNYAAIALITITVLLVTACGGGDDTTANVPTASVNPVSSATINDNILIVITFSESMAPESLVLAGTLSADADGGVWSDSTTSNDTLTISPTSSWTAGAHTLTVNVNNVANVAMATLNLNYTVDITLPVASVEPGTNSLITDSTSIVITFTESPNISTLSASGSLWDSSDSGMFSTVTNANDTLTISPATTWATGAGTMSVDIDDLVGNSLSTLNLSYTVDAISASGTVSPVSGGALLETEDIVISFDESMDTSSRSFANTLADNIGNSVWSTSTNANDVLTISPTSSWAAGNQALDISVTDVAGNETTLNLEYTIAGSTINDCTFSTATDLTGQANITITNTSAWSSVNGHSACIIVSSGTNVTWEGNFGSHPLVGGESPTKDDASPISLAGPGSGTTPVVINFSTMGDFGYYCSNHTSSMKGVVFVR